MVETNNTKQAAWVAIGALFSFAVGIVSPMILSRVFTKADYGTYKQVMYVYSTLLVVFTLGLPKAYAYFLPKYGREYSKDIINKVTYLFVGLGLVFSIILFSCSGIIANILKNPDLSLALKCFAPTPLFLLPALGVESIYTSFRKTQFITIYTILTRVFTVSLTVLPVYLMNGTYIHAIIGFDIASFLTCILALFFKNYPIRNENHKKSSLSYKQIFQFSIPLMVASIWGIIIQSSSQFFISRYYGKELFAEFSNGFIDIPFAQMIIGSVAAVLLPRFSELEKGEKMNDVVYSLWNSALEKSAKLIFPILVFSIVFSKLFMICMYGDTYINSYIYFIIKNISGLLYIVPFAPIMLAVGKTKSYANIHMVIAFLIVILEFTCVKTIGSPVAIAVASEVCQALKIYLMMRVIAQYAGKSVVELIPIRHLGRILLLCFVASISTYAISLLMPINKWLLAIICGVLFCAIYYVLCKLTKLSYKEIAEGLLPSFCKPLVKYIP